MLFNSFEFIFGFFPVILVLYWFMHRFGVQSQNIALVAASLIFYAAWDFRFLSLLLGSVFVNYMAGKAISNCIEHQKPCLATTLLAGAVTIDILGISIFKYAYFIIYNVNLSLGTNIILNSIILPLGISFFTFEQIGFLLDVRRGETRPVDFLRYVLFVVFFPRLVAGPILRYGEIEPQLAAPRIVEAAAEDLAVGATMFFIGLVKKTVLADGIAPYATSVFGNAARGEPIDIFLSWGGAVAYACQLYFDFSGYSDMAIGAARCFGIRFPINFFSPYKATSIIEFWRYWHITLSRFLRDYLYIELGGNQRGTARRYFNLMITMLIGGLWHGASWTFVLWGGLHGLYLMINHAWLAICGRSAVLRAFRHSRIGAGFGFALTFIAVLIGWVVFRAPNIDTALNILGGMIGRHGAIIPSGLAFALEPFHGLVAVLGIRFADASGAQLIGTYLWASVLLGIAFLGPNTQELLIRYGPVLEDPDRRRLAMTNVAGPQMFRARWTPSRGWAIATGALAFFGIISITRVSEFLYWQF